MNEKLGLIAAAALLAGEAHAQELPEGWGPVGNANDRYTLSVEAEAGFTGTGLRVASTDAVDGNFGGVGQGVLAEDYLGQKIQLTGYVRTFDTTGPAGLWVRVDGPNGPLVLDNMQDRGPTGTTEWQQYSAVVPVAENATRIVFGVILAGRGEVHADDLDLQIAPADSPVTAAGSHPASRRPRNMSF